MDISAVQEHIDLKEMAQEVRQLSAEEQAERDRLLDPQVAIEQVDKDSSRTQMKLRSLHMDTLRRTALQYGTQMGLYWRTEKINEDILKKYEGGLDTVSFRPFIEHGRVLAPSIIQSKAVEAYDDNVLTTVNVSFTIDEEAQIVSVVPTFRDYLVNTYPAPEPVHEALMPTSALEERVWNENVNRGFDLGIQQANDIFLDSLQEFEMDVQGRITYLKMRALDMISPSSLEVTHNGVTFNGRTMNVGEVIYTLTDPAMYTRMQDWRTAWEVKSDD